MREDGSAFAIEWEEAPPVVRDMASVYAGETIALRGREVESALVDLAAGPGEGDEPVLELGLSQNADGQMSLRVTNGFDRTVKYRLGMMRLRDEDGRVLETSSCPVGAGLTNFETWPEPIFQLIVTDVRFLDDDDPAASRCE